jgi:hypothetical protein
MRFQMCLWEQGHVYIEALQLFSDLIGLSPNAIGYCHVYVWL